MKIRFSQLNFKGMKGRNELFSNLDKNYLFGRVPLVLTLFNDDDPYTPYVTQPLVPCL